MLACSDQAASSGITTEEADEPASLATRPRQSSRKSRGSVERAAASWSPGAGVRCPRPRCQPNGNSPAMPIAPCAVSASRPRTSHSTAPTAKPSPTNRTGGPREERVVPAFRTGSPRAANNPPTRTAATVTTARSARAAAPRPVNTPITSALAPPASRAVRARAAARNRLPAATSRRHITSAAATAIAPATQPPAGTSPVWTAAAAATPMTATATGNPGRMAPRSSRSRARCVYCRLSWARRSFRSSRAARVAAGRSARSAISVTSAIISAVWSAISSAG
ncbi:hypothetical protein GCM10023321_70080 [Pseudonocardia eucalypti]|uniref:Uncharacterized protein n=1 Tax=Pseudonocardia eucalypti TaxID=648755 RepID=A0ABP9R520_9PSEU